jgi:hypothetical protein
VAGLDDGRELRRREGRTGIRTCRGRVVQGVLGADGAVQRLQLLRRGHLVSGLEPGVLILQGADVVDGYLEDVKLVSGRLVQVRYEALELLIGGVDLFSAPLLDDAVRSPPWLAHSGPGPGPGSPPSRPPGRPGLLHLVVIVIGVVV